jgi:hypothetical protein
LKIWKIVKEQEGMVQKKKVFGKQNKCKTWKQRDVAGGGKKVRGKEPE